MFLFKNYFNNTEQIDDVKVIRTHRRIKTITIRVKNGVVELLCPLLTPRFFIKRIIEKKKNWIKKKQEDYYQYYKKIDPIEQGFLNFKGLNIKLSFKQGLREPVLFRNKTLKFKCISKKVEDKKKLVVEWLIREAEVYLKKRIIIISKSIGIEYKSLKIKSYSGRWGSCDKFGEICLNWKLIMLPKDIIDYVIIHELAHIVEPNHSKKFWDVVFEKDPHYVKKKKWLKLNGLSWIKF